MSKQGNTWGCDSSKFSDEHYRERLKSKCLIQEGGCWLYQGFLFRNGYGDMSYRNKNWRVHRLAFFLWKGPIPEGHDICHTCDVRNCVNPEHLWSGPRQLNNRDTRDKIRNKNTQKTTCPKGHPYDYMRPDLGYRGWRVCTVCQRARGRIKAGWPEDLAYSMPAGKPGQLWQNRLALTQKENP